jgi:hypothetical protein
VTAGHAISRVRPGAALALVAALTACGPRVDVHAERSRIATFPRYGTYAWAIPAAPARSAAETEGSLLDWRIRNAVDRALIAKGYVRTDGAASLLADYDVAVREEHAESFLGYFQYRHRGGTKDMGESAVAGYQEGTLVLHLVDARTRELAYRASATAVIEEGGDRRRLEEAVERMLADLPRAAPTGGGQ